MKKVTKILAMFFMTVLLGMPFTGTADAKVSEEVKVDSSAVSTDGCFHIYGITGTGVVTKQPTCVEEGEILWRCLKCGEKKSEKIEKIPHDYSDAINVKWPTCVAEGESTLVCSGCGDKKKVKLEKIPHKDEIFTNKKNPTCQKDGEETVICSGCGRKTKKIWPKLPHSYGIGTVTTKATCTKEGVMTYKCTGCTATKTSVIQKTAHIYDNGKVAVPETCTMDGQMLYTCTGCGVTKTQVIPMAHAWDEGTLIEKPFVDKSGLKDATCERCGEEGCVEIPPIFSDVYTDWYTEYVQFVFDTGLMSGMKGTTKFDTFGHVTKAQVAQVLYNMDGQPEVGELKVFEELQDVYDVEWYANAVAWAYNNGIVTGDLNTKKFTPDANVTREQLSLMVYRYAEHKGYDTSERNDLMTLVHQENTSNWARTAVEWSVGAGLISGVDKNGVKDLEPQGSASRAQMAAILQRFCENIQ